jgi:uncharacterized protein
MSTELEELPLFPLNTVLFPHAQIQLHVFEDRYRLMINECIEFDRPFGIVLIRSGSETGESEPYMVGTAVRVIAIQTYDDGKMDIQVQGERRFRIRKLDQSKSYPVGYVEPVIEQPTDEEDSLAVELFSRVRQDCEILLQRRFEGQWVKVVFPTDPMALSFSVANLLPMENIEKQRVLEITDTLERCQILIPIIEMNMMEPPDTPWHRLTSLELDDWIHPN